MLTNEQLAILLTFVFGTLAVFTWIVEKLLTLHASRIILIQKRSEEFIELSRNYYLQLALLVGGIQAETQPEHRIRHNILFFKLAKNISFYSKFLDEVGGVWIFPKKTQETEVSNNSQSFYSFINHSIFNDDREVVERVINHYEDHPKLLDFVATLNQLPEYTTFVTICNSCIGEKLFEYSRKFRESILDGVTEEYKVWYKFELKKLFGMRKKKLI
jgi:hypothetical protein